jgi:hypothetical protein
MRCHTAKQMFVPPWLTTPVQSPTFMSRAENDIQSIFLKLSLLFPHPAVQQRAPKSIELPAKDHIDLPL